jgi:hypothetical protein
MIQNCCGSGIQCFFDAGIRDRKKFGSGIRNEHVGSYFRELRNNVFWELVETDLDPGSLGPYVKYGVRSPKFIWAPWGTAVLIGWDPATPAIPPAFGLIYEGAIGQPR